MDERTADTTAIRADTSSSAPDRRMMWTTDRTEEEADRVASPVPILRHHRRPAEPDPRRRPGRDQEWLESLDAVIELAGPRRARYLMLRLLEHARERQVGVPALRSTDYVNTIPAEDEPWFPGDEHVERRIRAFIRWNAAVMVTRANMRTNVGGHIATYASSASLYEVGFNHFFRGKAGGESGDQVYIQGHGVPRHLRPGVPRGPAHRREPRRLPPGEQAAAACRPTRTRG